MFLCSDRLDYSLQIGNIHTYVHKSMLHDIVEAHCYFVDIGQTDLEQICSRINNKYETAICMFPGPPALWLCVAVPLFSQCGPV